MSLLLRESARAGQMGGRAAPAVPLGGPCGWACDTASWPAPLRLSRLVQVLLSRDKQPAPRRRQAGWQAGACSRCCAGGEAAAAPLQSMRQAIDSPCSLHGVAAVLQPEGWTRVHQITFSSTADSRGSAQRAAAWRPRGGRPWTDGAGAQTCGCAIGLSDPAGGERRSERGEQGALSSSGVLAPAPRPQLPNASHSAARCRQISTLQSTACIRGQTVAGRRSAGR